MKHFARLRGGCEPGLHRIGVASRARLRRRGWAGLTALLPIALLAGASCEGNDGDRRGVHVRRLTYPMVAFRSEAPERRVITGSPVARWVELPEGRRRAIAANGDFRLALRQDNPAGAAIRGAVALDGRPDATGPLVVHFRVRIAAAAQEPGVPLLELALTAESHLTSGLAAAADPSRRSGLRAAEVRRFEAVVPEDWRGPGHIVLETSYPESSTSGERPTAFWIEPTIEWLDRAVAEGVPRPWNVLLITSDTTRQDDLGCYGGPADTPALDALARDGIVFEQAYTVALETTPSHASLMTASHAREHRVYDNATILPESSRTLAEVLRGRGYATAGFVSAVPVARSLGFAQGFDHFDDAFLLEDQGKPSKPTARERRADTTVSLFLEWLGTGKPAPFFAWLHLFDPHQPYAPPTPFLPVAADATLADPGIADLFVTPGRGARRLDVRRVLDLPPDRRARVDEIARSRYRGEISFVDQQVGRAIAALKEAGLFDRTVIVFLADHGENFLSRGELAYGHDGLSFDVVRVPLVLKLPQQRLAGTRRDAIVGTLDVAPTLLDLVGIPKPEAWSGQSLPIDAGEESSGARRALVIESRKAMEIGVRTPQWAYRQLVPEAARPSHANRPPAKPGRLRAGGDPESRATRLFDLASDPAEELDVADDPARRQIRKQLEDIAQSFLAAPVGGGERRKLDSDEHRKALQALGYVD